MHYDHEVFIKGIQQKRKLKLTFFSAENLQRMIRECAPLHYSKGRIEGDDEDCYYIWDLQTARDSRFLALPPSQIIKMELTESKFNIEDFSGPGRTTAGLTKGSNT